MDRRTTRFIAVVLTWAAGFTAAWAGGSSDAAASSAGSGKYYASEGIVIPPDTIYVDSYIASVDYHYPMPEEGIGVTLYSGHRQISSRGQDEVIQVGIQAGKIPFEDLPPMNLAFVIDRSGSMQQRDKLDWVKESFYIFIENVRDSDFVSLVVFDDNAKVIFPSTRMDNPEKRERFKTRVRAIQTGGGTNLVAGLTTGYEQVMANFRSEYVNRVLFLTDGVGNTTGILDMAATYREMGVNVSTMGLGRNFDIALITDLAHVGGGSSRFISDREEMEKIFGSELDRTIVPVARELQMVLEFLPEVEILDTWGYENDITENVIRYRAPTLHHGGYETIMVRVRIPPTDREGPAPLATFTVNGENVKGEPIETIERTLTVEFVPDRAPVTGYSDAMVLKTGTTLDYAEDLITIGELYYSGRGEESVRRAFDLTLATKKTMENARLRLDNMGFDNELTILGQYLRIIGEELAMEEDRVEVYVSDREIRPIVEDRPVSHHVANLFREMTLDLRKKNDGVVAVSGFTTKRGDSPPLIDLLNETALVEIGQIDTLTLVERQQLDEVLNEQEIQLTGLVDTATAIKVGEFLAAQYIVTGSVIEMSETVVIFGRVINVETAEVESAAQVIVPMSADIRSLLTL